MSTKGERKRRGFWGACRVHFRRVRITVWVLVLVLLGCLLYVNQVGLPRFVKDPLLQRLRDRGVDLQFSRLRLRFYEGIVAENVRFGQSDATNMPHLTVREIQLGLNWRALSRFQLQLEELRLRQGRLAWAIPGDPAGRELSVENIQTQLRFLEPDMWALDRFNADFASARIHLSGVVTNASAVSQWRFSDGEPAEAASAALWHKRLQRLADSLETIQFVSQPELRLEVAGDAQSLPTFTVRVAIEADDAVTPWGTLSQGRFDARLFAADTNGISRATLNIEAADAKTPWASVTNAHMEMRLASVPGQTNLIAGQLDIKARQAYTPWAHGTNLVFSAEWNHSITNPIPLSGHGFLTCDAAESRWISGRGLKLSSRLSTPEPGTLPALDPSWAWWTNIQPYALDWECSLDEVHAARISAADVRCAGTWRAPELQVTNFAAGIYDGLLDATVQLNVASRRFAAAVATDLDPRQADSALAERFRPWLDELVLNHPPRLEGQISVTLPAWTNRQPDWRAEVQPTLALSGWLDLASGGSFREVKVSCLSSHFAYSNLTWHVPDLTIARPEGNFRAEAISDDRTGDFFARINSSIDPAAVRPLLDQQGRKAFEILQLSQPPLLDAEVWGRYGALERLGARARVELTNFSFRGETAASLQTDVLYTNKTLTFLHPQILRGERAEQLVKADAVTADFNAEYVFITNGFSTAEPMVVARAIGEKIGRAIQPYTFSNPPTAYVSGTAPMRGEEGADLLFQVQGGPFHWWKFNVPWISAKVRWLGLRVALRDVEAKFYDGTAKGVADFEFPAGKRGADFTCAVVVTNALVEQLMGDLATTTNRMEGRLTGTLNFTRANTEDWNALFGYGDLKLRDGLIWEIPLFGVVTPVLEAITPGLGRSRASAGTCTYFINNGVIRTEDLEIRASGMRLQYRGTVDLEYHVNARVEAELLRNTWLVGPLVSTVLWPVTKMFEYRVTGLLSDPKMEPVYIVPKLMFLPFHPLKTLKGLLPEESTQRTNSPPVFKNLQ